MISIFIKRKLYFVLTICLSMVAAGCYYLPVEEPAEHVPEEHFQELNESLEEYEALPSPCELEESEDEPEEIEMEAEEEKTIAKDPPDEQDEPGEYKVIADGRNLLALVTKETKLKSDYVPPDLEPIPSYMNPSYSMQLRSEALKHLKELWQAAEEDGVTLSIRSAYRSYETQKWTFQDFASRHGEEEANRFSARPGQSEHQLGTTVDFGGTAVDFSAEFANTDQGRWLAENAHRFGFAMSYPEGKEHITGYIFEPWHYRYIGVDAAREWKDSGKTLREYLETKPQEFVE